MNRLPNIIHLFEFDFLISETDKASVTQENVKVVSIAAFKYLKQLCLSGSKDSRLLKLKSLHRSEVLQVQNYAGVIFTPDKTQIEVLPKVGKQGDDRIFAQKTLLMMLKTLKGFRHIETQQANIISQKMPLLEVFITQFLHSVNALVKRGLRSDYVGKEDNLAFLKGKLNVGKQIRHNYINKHKFYVEYDEFDQDRPANRLLHSALSVVMGYTYSNGNQKLLNELLTFFIDIPSSIDYKFDFSRIKLTRGMEYYQCPLDWARLILDSFSPLAMQGKNQAPSLLFPMEAVFESYVAKLLSQQTAPDYRVKEQVKSKTLVEHNEQLWFRLKPDLIIEKNNKIEVVLDTKWKILNQELANGTAKYGLSQSDFYQMFAYGQKYLCGKGNLFLLYPQTKDFEQAIPSSFCFDFELSHDLKLWVVPVDLGAIMDDALRIRWPKTGIYPPSFLLKNPKL